MFFGVSSTLQKKFPLLSINFGGVVLYHEGVKGIAFVCDKSKWIFFDLINFGGGVLSKEISFVFLDKFKGIFFAFNEF